MQKNQRNQQRGKGLKLVPVSISGAMVMVDPASINKNARTVHHGEYKGTKVNSPESFQIGDSILLWPESGKPQVISMSKAAAGVFSQQFLQADGNTVTLKS